MSFDANMTAQHWSERSARFSGKDTGLFWLEKTEIHRSINSKVSGDPDTNWIQYTLRKYFNGQLPLDRCLSLGCGEGRLERDLARQGTFKYCDAYDLAEGSIQLAKEKAKANELNHICYYAADINKISLPARTYDAVWIDSAMHHFEALEHICQQIKQALKPGGLFILNEYVGPNRFQFPVRQKEVANLCFQLLPSKYHLKVQELIALEARHTSLYKGTRWFITRLIDKIRDGDLIDVINRRFQAYRSKAAGKDIEKTRVVFPSIRDVIAEDPSEAIRSAEIVEVLKQDFEIIEKKDWGGNLLQFLLAGIAGNFSEEDLSSQLLLKMLINIEDTLLRCGEFRSDFTFIVARPLIK